jgi:hypothetical protein
VEAIPNKKGSEEVVMNFLEDGLKTIFGAHAKITTNNTKAIRSLALEKFCFKYRIIFSHSSNYYPRGNGLVESSNKNLMIIIKNIMGENKKAWDFRIKYALWVDHIMRKTSRRKTLFELVYGLEAKLPVNIQISTLCFEQQYMTDKEAFQGRINQLIELDESRMIALDKLTHNQVKIKGTCDHKARDIICKEGDQVLLWDKRKEKPRMHKKFDSLWNGPYKIVSEAGHNAFNLATLGGEKIKLLMNAIHLRLYFPGGT